MLVHHVAAYIMLLPFALVEVLLFDSHCCWLSVFSCYWLFCVKTSFHEPVDDLRYWK